MISIKKFLKSLTIAIEGIIAAFKREQSFRIQVLAAIVVLFLMFAFKLSLIERIILILVIFIVLSFELINSQIEKFLDIIQPVIDPKVKVIKDISAGAVLISALGAAIIGILIFFPYFVNLLELL